MNTQQSSEFSAMYSAQADRLRFFMRKPQDLDPTTSTPTLKTQPPTPNPQHPTPKPEKRKAQIAGVGQHETPTQPLHFAVSSLGPHLSSIPRTNPKPQAQNPKSDIVNPRTGSKIRNRVVKHESKRADSGWGSSVGHDVGLLPSLRRGAEEHAPAAPSGCFDHQVAGPFCV